MSGWEIRVIRNRYVDSVRLMQVAQVVRGHEGVERAEVAMGTAANLAALGVSCDASPTDVVIAVQGGGDGALTAAEAELAAPVASGGPAVADPPRSLLGAHGNVALISLPGEYAVLEAHRALTAGMHVFLFSDHVSAADEVELKRRGAARGLLVMGPGCGTAMLADVGLGFANVVRSGPVGIVAAAGTGAQEAAVLVDGAGAGVSQIIGVGGRDLSAEVGGIMFGEAMRMLAADDETETLLLVSKPPARSAVDALGEIDVGGKRVVAAFVGWDGAAAPFEIHPTLDAGAFAAAGAEPPPWDAEVRGDGRLLGLFSGGSLAHEAVTVLGPLLGPIGGNAGDGSRGGHAIYDLGEEEYTQGRPHPMVDLEVRRRMLEEAGDDVGCVLLDVVIGHGSHADPAGGLAPALERLARDRPVIAHVCGTRADPQDSQRQEATLREAGVLVAPTNAAAARLAGEGPRVRVAMLTYSVKPRGGVVHAVEVAEALTRRGHDVELFALAREGETLYRPTRVPLNLVRHVPLDAPFDERILAMLETYTDGLRLDGFDIVHSQDCLSANAALALRDAGAIDHVIRTVHHVDDFTSPSLVECQDRSILAPDHLLCVSEPWVHRLARDYGVASGLVSNGVDPRRFRAPRDHAERATARRQAGFGDRFAVLTVGGIEPRKGSLTLLEAFAQLRERVPGALLVIAGGTTLFDYRHELERFAARADELGVTEHVWRLGALESEELERLFRAADAFAFPSVKEGFGLAALEALAAELPLVVSDLDVFPVSDGESALRVPVGDAPALAEALARVARDKPLRRRLRAGGRAVVAAHTWEASAIAHERAYERAAVRR